MSRVVVVLPPDPEPEPVTPPTTKPSRKKETPANG